MMVGNVVYGIWFRLLLEALNALVIATAHGGRWQAMTVSNILSQA
jgi:hypothetical protein